MSERLRLAAIPRDKLLHFAAGSWAALLGSVLARWFGYPPALGALLASLCAGLAREVFNVARGGRWSHADVAWTVLGGVPVAAAASAGGWRG